MDLSEDAQKKLHEQRFQLDGDMTVNKGKELTGTWMDRKNTDVFETPVEVMACCQGNGNSSSCQQPLLSEKTDEKVVKLASGRTIGKKLSHTKSGKNIGARKVCSMPTWLESWEREDTYAALAVVFAAVSVAVAYSCYKQL